MMGSYTVKRAGQPVSIDADWEKTFWKDIDAGEVACVQWENVGHAPMTMFKVAYDHECLYVIFRVEDRFVRAVTTETHGPVWEDSCVEFFFTPQGEPSSVYFNLETNCCGARLMQQHTGPLENTRFVERADCEKIEIASSISGPVDPEIAEPTVWTVEYALPFEILPKYADFEQPKAGSVWYGNFYKCGDKTSHPHWMAWSPIKVDEPNFHLPEFFGLLTFE
jgi:hypothetical protein